MADRARPLDKTARRLAWLALALGAVAARAEPVKGPSYVAGQWSGPAQIYDRSCAACHATGIGPVLLGLQYPPEAYAAFVRNGAGTMPAFKTTEISDKELRELALWLAAAKPPAGAKK